jgi:probable HAF family extracellular repeat protein
MNTAGTICGYYFDGADVVHSFVSDTVNYTPLDFPGATETLAVSINDSGDVVGFFLDASNVAHGFKWSGGTFTEIAVPGTDVVIYGINNNGFIFGSLVDDHNVGHKFLRNPQGVVRYVNAGVALLYAGPNDHNTVVGELTRRRGSDVIRWNITTRSSGTIHIPDSIHDHGTGVNDGGVVVGYYDDFHRVNHGFIWRP